MTITFDIPNFVFKVGDEVEMPNQHNERSVFLRIAGVTMYGCWRYDGEGKAWASRAGIQAHYHTDVLPGSYHDTTECKQWNGSTWLVFEKDALEAKVKV
jgi:hypothetical protein